MKRLLAICALFVPLSIFGNELRGLWVDAFGPGFLKPKEVKKLASDCREYNFNALFVQMRKRGDAFYMPTASNPDPRNHNLATNFDALAEIIRECHDKAPRIQVHVWLTTYLLWSWQNPPDETNHLFNVHPEYLMKDSTGEMQLGEGYYLDPGHPDANLALLNVAKDIVSRYDIDGLHWDYVRYPEQNSGYGATAIKRYQEEFATTEIPKPNDTRFCDWRRRQLTDFLRWTSGELWEMKPRLVISAAVFSNFKDAHSQRFQDWVTWNKEGLIDALIPMNFSADNQHIFIPRMEFAQSNQWNRAVWIGQAAYMMSPKNTVKQLHLCRSNSFGGVILFSYRKPSKESTAGEVDSRGGRQTAAFDTIREQFQPEWESAPVLPWKTYPSKGIIKGTLKSADGKPIYNATVKLIDSPERVQKTEPHGSFAFLDVAPGEHRVEVSLAQDKSVIKKCSVKAGEVVNLTFAPSKN